MSKSILAITASVQHEESISRELVADLIAQISSVDGIDTLIERDLSNNEMELVTQSHVAAYYTSPAERTPNQRQLLEQSDTLLAELKSVDTLIIGAPMYNFSVPAVLKAWIDLVCRVGESFKYGAGGPVGLLNIDVAYVVVATGGTPVGGPADFLTPYLSQVAKFIGAKRVEVIAADKTNKDRQLALEAARGLIAKLGHPKAAYSAGASA